MAWELSVAAITQAASNVNCDAVGVNGWSFTGPRPAVWSARHLVSGPEAFVVADGIQPGYGGLGARLLAEQASTPSHVHDSKTVTQTIAAVHEELLADDYFFDYWNIKPDQLRLPGATVVGCRFDLADRAAPVLLFNVGDASAFFLKDGCLTKESISDRTESGMLTQAVGGGPPADPTPHIVVLDQLAAHNRVLLCSDGLTDTLQYAELEALLRLPSIPGKVAAELLATTLQKRPADDVTAIVIDLTDAGPRRRFTSR